MTTSMCLVWMSNAGRPRQSAAAGLSDPPRAPARAGRSLHAYAAVAGRHAFSGFRYLGRVTVKDVLANESLGICRDDKVSKGCTSPFAPIWIDAMVRRQG